MFLRVSFCVSFTIILVFGLWRVCFPPVLVRTGRRLPVQALGERGVLVAVTGYPRGGAPGPVNNNAPIHPIQSSFKGLFITRALP